MKTLTSDANSQTVRIGSKRLEGFLAVPEDARGLVIFAHGSGSSRLSPRNNFVAERLRESRLATLLFDLLTPEEAADRDNVFDIRLLGARVAEAITGSYNAYRWRCRRCRSGTQQGCMGAAHLCKGPARRSRRYTLVRGARGSGGGRRGSRVLVSLAHGQPSV